MTENSTQWLVRHKDVKNSVFQILGPYSKEDLCKKILAAEFEPSDSFCQSQGYWFELNELAEVKKHFGIEASQLKGVGDPNAEATHPNVQSDQKTRRLPTAEPRKSLTQEIPQIQKTVLNVGRERFWNIIILISLIAVGFIVRWLMESLSA